MYLLLPHIIQHALRAPFSWTQQCLDEGFWVSLCPCISSPFTFYPFQAHSVFPHLLSFFYLGSKQRPKENIKNMCALQCLMICLILVPSIPLPHINIWGSRLLSPDPGSKLISKVFQRLLPGTELALWGSVCVNIIQSCFSTSKNLTKSVLVLFLFNRQIFRSFSRFFSVWTFHHTWRQTFCVQFLSLWIFISAEMIDRQILVALCFTFV